MPVFYSALNDYDYLIDLDDWLERMRVRLQMLFRSVKGILETECSGSQETYIQTIMSGLKDLLNDIDPQKGKNRESIRANLVGRGALFSYLLGSDLPADLNSEHRKEIEAIFFATYLRNIFLERYRTHPELIEQFEEERNKFRARLITDYTDVIVDTTDSIEIIYLYRFERAVLLLYEITRKIEIKLSLKVGNLLEGCPDNKRYIIGGRSAKDTMRRVSLIEHLVAIHLPENTIAKKKREKRKFDESNNDSEDETGDQYVSTISPSPVALPTANSSNKRQKNKTSEYLKLATAINSSSNGTTIAMNKLGNLASILHQFETDHDLIFVDYDLLNLNTMASFEQNYQNELNSHQENGSFSSSSFSFNHILENLSASYQNKSNFVFNAESIQVGKSPFRYTLAINKSYGYFRLLKVFPFDGLSGDCHSLIQNEVNALRLLNNESIHPNIIRFWDYHHPSPATSSKETMNYFCLEAMDMELKEYVKNFVIPEAEANGKSVEGKIRTMMRDMASTVYSLHSIGLVHRTISIEKFMVKFSGSQVITKLCDLSSVLPEKDSLYFSRFTPVPANIDITNSAPELAVALRDDQVVNCTREMDLWSLGKIFFYFCTGLEIEWVPSSSWDKDISDSLEFAQATLRTIIKGLLLHSPSDRKQKMPLDKVIKMLSQ